MERRDELEWKFDVDASAVLPSLDPADAAAARDLRQHAVYWDTARLWLLGRGITVRHRDTTGDPDEAWTVKLPVARGAGSVERLELAFEGDGDRPPAGVVDLLAACTRDEPLGRVATIDTERRATVVHDRDGRAAAELVDDRVVGTLADGSTRRFRQVEVEAVGDDAATARRVARFLRECGLPPSVWNSKLEQVLGTTGGHDVAVASLGPWASVDDLIRAMFARAADAIIEHDPLIRAFDDPEAVHRSRVAARELRSNLRSLRSVLDDAAVAGLEDELRWFGDALGGARDLDVLRESIEDLLPSFGVAPADPVVRRLVHGLEVDRDERRGTMAAAVRSERVRVLVARLVEGAVDPPVRADLVGRRARDVVTRPVRRAWRRVGAPMDGRPDGETPDAVLHEVRKRAKRARYAAELVAPVVPGASDDFAMAMKGLQDTLGRAQDCVTAQRWLAAEAASADAEVAFLAGALWTRFDDERVRARRRFIRFWDRRALRRSARWFR